MFHDSSKQKHDFRMFKTMIFLGDIIYNNKIEIFEANQEQYDLLAKQKVMFLIVHKIFMKVDN